MKERLMKIDGDKLKGILKRRMLKFKDVGEALGYTSNFISTSCARGSIAIPAMKGLELLYGIKYEDIKPVVVVKQEEDKEVKSGITENIVHLALTDTEVSKLYNIMYHACYKAFCDALDEDDKS